MPEWSTMDTDLSLCVNAKIVWNKDLHTIDYIRPQTNEKTERKKKSKTLQDREKLDRDFNRQTKAAERTYSDDAVITIAEVKEVAYDLMSQHEKIPSIFDALTPSKRFDTFLLYLLKYFQFFYDKRAEETKEKTISIGISAADKEKRQTLEKQLAISQKELGLAYSALVLGLDLEQVHHMAAGEKRQSESNADRLLFDTLFQFSTLVVWITYKRREYDLVKTEIGRLLRTEAFNATIRPMNIRADKFRRVISEAKSAEKSSNSTTKSSIQPARRSNSSVSSLLDCKSPVMASLLPTPREDAFYLFSNLGKAQVRARKELQKEANKIEGLENILREVPDFTFGILGDLILNYNPRTLLPNAEGGDEQDGQNKSKSAHSSRGPSRTPGPVDIVVDRTKSAVSRVTTEPGDDDNDPIDSFD